MQSVQRVRDLTARATGKRDATAEREAVAEALIDLLGRPDREPRRVFVFAEAEAHEPVLAWIGRFPPGTVHVVSAQDRPDWQVAGQDVAQLTARDRAERIRHLELLGPVDVIVDVLPQDTDAQIELWHDAFLHLRPDGLYIIDTSSAGAHTFGTAWSQWLALLLGGDRQGAAPTARDREFTASTGEVAVSRDAIVIRKQQRHYLKLRDDEADRILASREPGLTVTELATLPAGTLVNRGTVTSHEAGVEITALDVDLPYPALHLRHYDGPVSVVSNALVFSGDTVLPDSFRHHLERSPRNPKLTSVSERFGRIATDLLPHRHLDGAYYHLDSENSGHYGHLTTEVISRLWGWDAAKRAVPDLKALFRVRWPGERDPALERRVFSAYGIDPADIVWTGVPVTVDSLVAATPMWHNQFPHYVHPQIAETWERLATSLIDPDAPAYDRIFVSRSGDLGNRACRNIREVEDWFRERGFEIVYPELHDLGTQAGIFGAARVVAGFGGSAMFNVLFARRLETMIVLNHEAYTARNEHLFASVLGVDTHYFWSTPDVEHPTGGWSEAAYYSGWQFDFARNAADLDRLIKEL
ncbi:DUF563 domain-containing protein [uncultured Jatrophihabitans sp.]|uniref:glycosyltransferase family 61 protein n=1 Tax=uncultured Jatrophihabitans sp. TaxID=1610747 RepID=UPI0035CC36A7